MRERSAQESKALLEKLQRRVPEDPRLTYWLELNTLEPALTRAEALYNDGHPEQAEHELSELVSTHPTSAEARLRLDATSCVAHR